MTPSAHSHESQPEARGRSCDYCGLPLSGSPPSGEGAVEYCCFGCRFAAQVTQERGETGATQWSLIRLGVSIFFTMNVVMMSMALWSDDWYTTTDDALSVAFLSLLRYGSLFSTTIVVLLLGSSLAENAWEQLRRGILSTDLLLISGVIASFAYSAVSVLRGEGPIYFEVGCVVLVMVTLGRWFEATGRLKASAALDALEKLLPAEVRRIADGRETVQPISAVRRGDCLRILAGERFPTDGTLVDRSAFVDEQFLTGESWPVSRGPGERILGGSLNLDGDALLHVTAEPSEGTLARLIAAVREARQARGRWHRLADRVSTLLFPIIGVTALAAFAWHTVHTGLEAGVLSALAVTLIACPCALGLATPLCVWVALGAAAQRQVLFRNGDVLERLANVRMVCFDKTGTLTTGEPRLMSLTVDPDTQRGVVLREAGRIARSSSHLLARAVARAAGSVDESELLAPATVIPGRGVRGYSADLASEVLLGSPEFLTAEKCQFPDALAAALNAARDAGRSVTLVGWQGRVRGQFEFEEQIRPSAATAIEKLRALGCEIVVLTGDHAARGAQLAAELNVTVHAGLLPDDKRRMIETLRARGPVAMAGDGVNDAPSLAASDVGIALECGADVSRETAGICLLGNDLERIPWALELARRSVRTIRLNLVWAFGYNFIGVGLAAAGWLNPAIAAFIMVLSSVLVITNSLRLGHQVAANDGDARQPGSVEAATIGDDFSGWPLDAGAGVRSRIASEKRERTREATSVAGE